MSFVVLMEHLLDHSWAGGRLPGVPTSAISGTENLLFLSPGFLGRERV